MTNDYNCNQRRVLEENDGKNDGRMCRQETTDV